jgi:hypothetical protein
VTAVTKPDLLCVSSKYIEETRITFATSPICVNTGRKNERTSQEVSEHKKAACDNQAACRPEPEEGFKGWLQVSAPSW